jgi:phage terminase large subunit-like protein
MSEGAGAGFYFDQRAAEMAIRFFERVIVHTKGDFAGKPFELQPWQRDQIIAPLFGWKRPDGSRRYRRAYMELPRKSGKSTIASGVALLLLLADNEAGAEIYSAAADREQARIVFEQAKAFVEQSPILSREVAVYRNYLKAKRGGGEYKAISADAMTKHGYNASGIVFDELHSQPNRELWDVLTTSMGARRQPLLLAITTAGFDRTSICWEQHEHATRVLADPAFDTEYFAYIAAAPETADWTDPAVWRLANPNLGITVAESYIAAECKRAQSSPAFANTFKRLYLNIWTSVESRWLNEFDWRKCGAELPDLRGRKCYGGLDLASTIDIAALVLVFPPITAGEPVWLLPSFWIPADNMRARELRDRVPYGAWQQAGHLRATAGNVIDYSQIEADIIALAATYQIEEIAYDKWNASAIVQRLAAADLKMIEMGQGFASMTAPTKELERLILSAGVGHGGQPVLAWMAANCMTEQDAAGNIKPSKARSRQKIDGIVAAIMGIDRITRHTSAPRSVYEDRGMVII